jgi:hypothetical protein
MHKKQSKLGVGEDPEPATFVWEIQVRDGYLGALPTFTSQS